MRTECQDYEDSTYAQAVQSGYDTLQLKYDGWWSRTEISGGEGRLYSKTARLVTSFPANPSVTGTFIGEYMFGTQWSQPADRQGKIYLHDVWRIGNSSLETFTYRDRYGILRANISLLGVPFEIVNNYPITAQPDIWQRYVATSLFEGVVYRRRLSPVDDTILREKAVVTEDVQVIGFKPGEGKHAERLGALVCQNRQGVEIAVGGGLDDKTREDIWNSQSAYLGRWCTIEGRARFASGAIRHPNFIAWRADLD